MRSSIILTSLLATLAVANPVEKRYLTTEVETYTVWTTVTKGDAAPTSFSNVDAEDSSDDNDYDRDGRGRGRGRGRHSSYSPAVDEPTTVPSSSDVVVPTSAPQPAPSSSTTEAPVTSDEPAPTSSEEPAEPTLEPAPTPATSASNEETSASAPAPSAPAPSAPAPSSEASPPTAGSSYGQKILDQHNIHRANHTDTDPLTWSDKLTATALKIANSCVYEHDTATDKSQYAQGYGQNIGAGSPPEDVPAMITNGMYNDEAPAYEGLYGQDDPDMSDFHTWGHFSQIVWRNTKEVGCATVKCNTLQNTGGNIRPYFTVCNYAPPGNFGGEYDNVGTRLGKPTVTV